MSDSAIFYHLQDVLNKDSFLENYLKILKILKIIKTLKIIREIFTFISTLKSIEYFLNKSVLKEQVISVNIFISIYR